MKNSFNFLLLGLSILHTLFSDNIHATQITKSNSNSYKGKECEHLIYCKGEIRDTLQLKIQEYSIYSDCKTFVDQPLKFDIITIVQNFADLNNSFTKANIMNFLKDNFYEFQADVQKVNNTEWKPNVKFLSFLSHNSSLLKLAEYAHQKWNNLLRKFNHDLLMPTNYNNNSYTDYQNKTKIIESSANTNSNSIQTNFQNLDSARYTSIETPNAFIIAGERFGEYYYWDTFFIIQGLLTSELVQTAVDTLYNFFSLIDRFGYVFNGGRIYYSDRSQPPLLTQMVESVYQWFLNQGQNEKARRLIEEAYPRLVKEHSFWEHHRRTMFNLAQYDSVRTSPRPESYLEDIDLAQKMHVSGADAQILFRKIAAAAESGMDFSSRWFEDPSSMTSINTTDVIPTDLNAILYKNEKILALFASLLGIENDQIFYFSKAEARKQSIMKHLFDENQSSWFDFNISNKSHHNEFYSSNYVSLWALEEHTILDSQLETIISHLDDISNKYPGGIPTSFINSTQQWDYPNLWPPEIFFVVNGLKKQKHNKQAQALSQKIACQYINNVLLAFEKDGVIYEKYDVEFAGSAGGGGEYKVQTGFGWSNGVLLSFLDAVYSSSKC